MTAVIAADRYDCVCRPHRRFFTYRRGKITAGAVLVFSLLINIPAFIPRTDNLTLTTVEQAFQAFCFITAMVMITICYGRVYLTIKKHVKVDAGAKSGDRFSSRVGDECSTKLSTAAFTTVHPKTHLNAVSSVSASVSKPCSSQKADAGMAQVEEASSHDAGVDEPSLDESKKPHFGRPSSARMTTRTGTSKNTDSLIVIGNGILSQILGDAGRAVPKADAAVFQRKTTRMLFITSVVFLLTWLPYWVMVSGQFASYANPVYYRIMEKLYITLYINNAVNPLIYGLANRRFRKDCKLVLKRIKGC
ncbi:muscarinic acetylcholine receptor M1-like [Acanthaster planci]|uniref:Muscarinic acetylcholine receptor M1-like n=1 Tax=Acanthaster planci TaxID=133434 RepID=A0A8B7Z3N1_ACAPL|nr:muscarinic acetylcholine receptor M1-like [Acanthaster planci]